MSRLKEQARNYNTYRGERTIFDDIREGKYSTNIPYPAGKPKVPKLNSNDPDYDEVSKKIAKIHEVKLNRYREAIKAYQVDENEKMNRFREDALEYCGLLEHPKASDIYSYAWNEGHSSGLHEVVNKLEELADLFLD